ncbi:DBD_Tnp_Mut domain-containing protein [Raphanus sativus]|nr:DBD_Tnp_Mut domain-containing protein [Raphanus sativus]
MKVPGDFTKPPLEILEDQDVALFMAVRMEFASLVLCVVYGSMEVGEFRRIRRDEFGLTEDGTDVVPPKPVPWRDRVNLNHCFRTGGYLQVSEEKLMTICSTEQMAEIRRTALRMTKHQIFRSLEVVDDITSETDSSDGLEVFTHDDEGMIRLEDVPTEPEAEANLTLAISPGGSSYKGKGLMTEPEEPAVELLTMQIGSGSGYGNTQEDDVPLGNHGDDAGWREGDEKMENNGHLYVGQLFLDRDAFKVHMSLHALANKYRFFVRKSEPGKVVLECNGVNCHWRVYAVKNAGESVESKVAQFYTTINWASSYSGAINPVDQAKVAVYKFGVDGEDGHLRPPATRCPPGRPRKARMPSRGEFKMVGAFKRRRTCSRCGASDHNKVTCKMPI